MPEYLSPGVYVEEVPSALKAIEGVSTSTAAFVGRARRGPVPGYNWAGSTTPGLPFTPTGDFTLEPDPAPVLVTSFSEFQRQFGPPLEIPRPGKPDDFGFLGWAVRAFFNNGGKRAFIARVAEATDTPARLQGAQGLAYRLLRSAAPTDTTVFLKSNRGLAVGDALTFVRHSNGQNAVGSPVRAALVSGTAEPFALANGDQITVQPTPPLAAVTATITANPATLLIPLGGPNYALASGDTLVLRVGAATAPLQTILFSATDLNAPITSGAATVAQVLAVLQRYLSGARVFLSGGGQVAIETDLRGTSTSVQVVSGTALGALGLVAGSTPPPPGGNVANADQVTIVELAALLPSADFTVDADPAGRIRFSTVATGAAVTIEVTDASGTGVLQKLGLGPGASILSAGAAAVPSTLTITGYDPQSNSVTFSAPVGVSLEATDVFATVVGSPTAPNPAAGPRFFARSPGSWGDDIRVQIANADRQAVAILGTVPIAAGATTLSVRNTASFYVGAVVEIDYSNNARSTHEVTAVNAGTRQITLNTPTTAILDPSDVPAPTVRTLEIDVVIQETTGSAPTEIYRGLSWNQGLHAEVSRHYSSVINPASRLVWVQPPGIGVPVIPGSEDSSLGSQPTTLDGFPMSPDPLTLGAESFPNNDATWVGADNGPGQRSGIESLKDLTEARIIAAPGKTSAEIQLALIAQCETMRYRFALLDGERDPAGGAVTSILTHRNLYDTSFAAYYAPWIAVTVDGQTAYLPPSGYLAGVYARTDNSRGVWKAPANESVLTALGLKTQFTSGEQDLLNPRGVNLIRRFDIGGIRVWGARTLSSDPDVKYINVRRTLIFLEASIDRGTQWVVFEPNTPDTWTRLKDSVSSFLLTQWRSGALFGESPEQAFFVRCGEETMTSDDILNGRLICEVGVSIVRPAEFVIFRIQQITKFFED